MNDKESKALQLTTDLWAAVVAMNNEDELHRDLINDMRHHIHAIQALIMARPEIRKHGIYHSDDSII
jgi:hypothetical protein